MNGFSFSVALWEDQSEPACWVISSAVVETLSFPTMATKSVHAASRFTGAVLKRGAATELNGAVDVGSRLAGFLVPK